MITLAHCDSLNVNDRVAAAVHICVQSGGWDDRTVRDLSKWVVQPVAMGKAVFMMDGVEPVAFAVYANINDDQVADMVNCIPPTLEGWNAGPVLWITDLAAIPGYGGKFARRLKEDWFDHENQPVFWWRPKHTKIGNYVPERRH